MGGPQRVACRPFSDHLQGPLLIHTMLLRCSPLSLSAASYSTAQYCTQWLAPTPLCRCRIRPWRDTKLYPGDLVHFAEPDIGFIVQLGPGGQPSLAPAVGDAAAAAAADAEPADAAAVAHPLAVQAALDVATALEAAAAAGGVFPTPAGRGAGGDSEGVAQRARDLMTAGKYVPARMLLLGQCMRQPLDGGGCKQRQAQC